MVSLATGLGALLHYVKLVGNTTRADIMFIVITGVSSLSTLILFLTLLFNLQQKITRSTKSWNIFMAIYTLITAVLLLICSSLLVREAVKLGDAYHSDSSNQAKCIKCSKINVATVFGFLSWILLTLDLFLYMRQYGFPFSKRKERRVTVQPKASIVSENDQEQVSQPQIDQEPLPLEPSSK